MKKTKIELGIWSNPQTDHKTWIWQDILPLPNVDLVCNANNLSMIKSNSMDEVFASHLIEHFFYNEIGAVLKEWVRILKPGGKLTIILPDFMKLWECILDKSKFRKIPLGIDTIEDWMCRIMANDKESPHTHINHYPYYWYEDAIKKAGCTGKVERRWTWNVPEVIIYAIKNEKN